jgi:hypothetical protein
VLESELASQALSLTAEDAKGLVLSANLRRLGELRG